MFRVFSVLSSPFPSFYTSYISFPASRYLLGIASSYSGVANRTHRTAYAMPMSYPVLKGTIASPPRSLPHVTAL